MYLQSAFVKSYRVHQELKLDFDPSRTLVTGPNEVGKSTLVEAIHRALFLKARVTGDTQKSMVSYRFAGHPEVEVCFSCSGLDYVVRKVFSGANGSVTLTQVGGGLWIGDEAEERLAKLLGVEPLAGGRGLGGRVAEQWSHLWVWQGQSGSEPLSYATQQQSALLERLQKIGGAAAFQSVLDTNVADYFTKARDEIFKNQLKPKAGSPLEKAERELEEATEARKLAGERWDRLQGYASDFERAQKTWVDCSAGLQKMEGELAAVEEALGKVAELRRVEEKQKLLVDGAKEKLDALIAADKDLTKLHAAIHDLAMTLQPRNEEAQQLRDSLGFASQKANLAATAFDAAVDFSRQARMRRDLSAAVVTQGEAAELWENLRQKESKAQELREEAARLRGDLARLPSMTEANFRALQKQVNEHGEALAALKAMAAGIEVVAGGLSIQVDGELLPPGATKVVTQVTDVRVGDSVHLRINPGGGMNLQEAGRRELEARQKVAALLAGCGIGSVEEAQEILMRRRQGEADCRQIEGRLNDLDASGLALQVASAHEAVQASEAEMNRRLEMFPGGGIAPTLAEARQVLAQEKRAVEAAEKDEKVRRAERDAAQEIIAAARKRLEDHEGAIRRQSEALTEMKKKAEFLETMHGDAQARSASRLMAENRWQEATTAWVGTREALDLLRPDDLARNQTLLAGSQERLRQSIQAAEVARAVAKNNLSSDGSEDPSAVLNQTEARLKSAREHESSVRQQALAIDLLHRLFTEKQRALAEEFTRPFAEKITAYLQCLFGPTARASVTMKQGGFEGLQLIRSHSSNDTAISFDSLSGGAKEQVAAAVRLAMAELLAADHGGKLPVIFDDAFAYSDPQRIWNLQHMLDFAASRGLQIIVLTCSPSEYASFGAATVALAEIRG